MNKNFISFLSLFFIVLFSENSSSQTFQWAKSGDSEGRDYGNYMTTDDSGNVYVSGQFEYNCHFDSKTVSTSGQHDAFVAKYNTAGTLMWVKKAGGTDGDAGHGIGLDAARNVYITGEFEKTCYFTSIDSVTVGGTGINNIYLSKYNYNGQFQWVKSAVSNGDGRGRGLVTDPAGNSYFTGNFARICNFGSIVLNYNGWTDVFLAKYNSNGDAIWAKKIGGSQDDKGKGVALDNSNNVYLVATFTQSATISGNTINAVGLYDSFLAKYDTSGAYQWVRTAGGTDTTKMAAVTTDNDGNIYVTGYFRDVTNFGSTQLTSLGSYEFFLAKYNPNGSLIWAKRGGGIYEDFGQGICFDTRNNVLYVTGQFDYQATFDTISVNSAGNRDVFIACYDTSGSIRWIRTGGGTERDAGYAVANDTLGNIYGTGFYDIAGYFGSHAVGTDSLANVFVTKISPAIASQPTTPSSNPTTSITNCTDINLSWTSGNGTSRIVIAKSGAAVNNFPSDGNFYTASSTFGSGSYLGNGNYVVYSGSGNSCVVTGLTAGNTYYFAIIEFNGTGVTCNYSTASYLTTNVVASSFTVSVSGSSNAFCPGGSSTLTASGGLTYQWSPATGLSSTTGSVVTATPNSSITYTVLATDLNGCQSTWNISITVYSLPTVTLNNFTDVCLNSAPVTLTGGAPSGGTYSGPYVTTGMFDPVAAGLGSHSITYSYTDGNGCSDTATASILVRSLPAVTLNTLSPVCVDGSPVVLSGGTPSGGDYSGAGVTSGSFDPTVAGVGTHIITYTFTDTYGCSNSDTATILVQALPTVTLGNFNPICENAAATALTGGIPTGGTYSGTGVISGTFYPNIAGVGQHNITYNYTDGTGCSNNATNTITVNALPVVTLGSFNPVCHNAPGVTLTGGLPAGGTYSGSGVVSGIFYPTATGSNTIIYNYTDANGCSNFATSTIFVNTLPAVTVSPFNPVCFGSPDFPLTGGNPAGGTWTGSGVSGGNFYPTSLGNNTLIYNYTDGNGCSNFAQTVIVVNPVPVVSLGDDTTICVYSNILLDAGSGYSSYLWSNSETTQSILVDSTGTGLGTAVISVTVTNSFNCAAQASISITFDICADIDEAPGRFPAVLVYPNPFSEVLTVIADPGNHNITIKMFDVYGQLVKKWVMVNATEVINPGVASGIYFLRMEAGRSSKTIKVVKTGR